MPQLRKLIVAQAWPRSRPGPVVQASQALGVVAHHGVAQRLPLHAGQPCRLRSPHALQRVGNRLHPSRRCAMALATCPKPKLRRRQSGPDREAFSPHGPLLTVQTAESDHPKPFKITSEPKTARTGMSDRAVNGFVWIAQNLGYGVVAAVQDSELERIAGHIMVEVGKRS